MFLLQLKPTQTTHYINKVEVMPILILFTTRYETHGVYFAWVLVYKRVVLLCLNFAEKSNWHRLYLYVSLTCLKTALTNHLLIKGVETLNLRSSNNKKQLNKKKITSTTTVITISTNNNKTKQK